MQDLLQLSIYHQNSLNPSVSARFSELILSMPIEKSLTTVRNLQLKEQSKNVRHKLILDTLRDHFGKGTYGFMEARDFALFMDYLLQGVKYRYFISILFPFLARLALK